MAGSATQLMKGMRAVPTGTGGDMFENTPEGLVKKIQLMKGMAFFAGFADPDLVTTAQVSQWLRFPPEGLILQEGEPGTSFWIILKGSVRVEKLNPQTGKTVILTQIKQGECFGEMSVITGAPRSANIIANDEVYLYKIEGEIINKAPDSLQAKFFRRFSEILVNRLYWSSQQLSQQKPSP